MVWTFGNPVSVTSSATHKTSGSDSIIITYGCSDKLVAFSRDRGLAGIESDEKGVTVNV